MLTSADSFKRLTALLQTYPRSTQEVLLIQEDPTTEQILRRLLTKAGWQVLTTDLSTALRPCDRPPDVILMDLYLESFEVKTLIKQVIQEMQPQIEANGNRLAVFFAPDLGTCQYLYR